MLCHKHGCRVPVSNCEPCVLRCKGLAVGDKCVLNFVNVRLIFNHVSLWLWLEAIAVVCVQSSAIMQCLQEVWNAAGIRKGFVLSARGNCKIAQVRHKRVRFPSEEMLNFHLMEAHSLESCAGSDAERVA